MESPGELVRIQIPGPAPEFLTQGSGWESENLHFNKLILMLLFCRSHFRSLAHGPCWCGSVH